MIVNGAELLAYEPIRDMETSKKTGHGVSYGLSEAGYDIRIKQDIRFVPIRYQNGGEYNTVSILEPDESKPKQKIGRFCLASAIEEFLMPSNLVGIVHDKSTWARKGLSVFNTVIEPGFCGGLTLELVYHGQEDLHIPAGAGIAQVLFHETLRHGQYSGKYQNQSSNPEPSRFE